MAYYEKALALDGEMGDAWYNLGLLYLSLDDKSGARKCFVQAYRTNPNDTAYKSKMDEIASIDF